MAKRFNPSRAKNAALKRSSAVVLPELHSHLTAYLFVRGGPERARVR